ncbi:hypothetical protein BBK82_10630 [Lentzea guizhouensis]|uniref:Uncharacterized protein n=1 Tax=Lentzea guizhouensis TaxID=1586287 RepID=A0A1B2HFH5_9PSEU|nr:hypothetical protein [Lentzea guizhouensis]ANZ36452.1 hypothetical protein BBK82_10630 [Lentzea guizhouensis]
MTNTESTTTAVDGSVALDDLAHDVELLRIIEESIKRHSALKDELRSRLKKRLGNQVTGTVNGLAVVEWTNESRVITLVKTVQERFPDVARECEDIVPVRKFRLLPAA